MKPGENAKPLEDGELKKWNKAKDLMVDLAQGEIGFSDLKSKLQSIDLDMKAVLNALNVPEDAGENAGGLEKILHRIPDGWGRWISCSKGWYLLLVELDEKLSKIDPNYEVHQVKEKFGGLRYYYGSQIQDASKQEAMENLVTEYEKRASLTCEDCGKKGRMLTKNGWYRTLCSNCARDKGYNLGSLEN